MSKEFVAARLDLRSFAQAGAELSGQDALGSHPRLLAEAQGNISGLAVTWKARGELRAVRGGADQVWIHLVAGTTMPMICQRCLTPVEVDVAVDRAFRFVPDEETAAAEDEEAEEDVLALSRAFNLPELVEDELLMELPVVPRHETCPVEVKLAVADKEFEAEMAAKPNPFAALSKLKG
ncbi:MAG: YceD family protein [Pseudomonadota bacterium]